MEKIKSLLHSSKKTDTESENFNTGTSNTQNSGTFNTNPSSQTYDNTSSAGHAAAGTTHNPLSSNTIGSEKPSSTTGVYAGNTGVDHGRHTDTTAISGTGREGLGVSSTGIPHRPAETGATGAGYGSTGHSGVSSDGRPLSGSTSAGTQGMPVTGKHSTYAANMLDPRQHSGLTNEKESALTHHQTRADTATGGGAEAADGDHPGGIKGRTIDVAAREAGVGGPHSNKTHLGEEGARTGVGSREQLAERGASYTGSHDVSSHSHSHDHSHAGRDVGVAGAGASVLAAEEHRHDKATLGSHVQPLGNTLHERNHYGNETSRSAILNSDPTGTHSHHTGTHGHGTESYGHQSLASDNVGAQPGAHATRHGDGSGLGHTDFVGNRTEGLVAGAGPNAESSGSHYRNAPSEGAIGSTGTTGPAPNTSGPHSKDWMNKLDPRVDAIPQATGPTGSRETTRGSGHEHGMKNRSAYVDDEARNNPGFVDQYQTPVGSSAQGTGHESGHFGRDAAVGGTVGALGAHELNKHHNTSGTSTTGHSSHGSGIDMKTGRGISSTQDAALGSGNTSGIAGVSQPGRSLAANSEHHIGGHAPSSHEQRHAAGLHGHSGQTSGTSDPYGAAGVGSNVSSGNAPYGSVQESAPHHAASGNTFSPAATSEAKRSGADYGSTPIHDSMSSPTHNTSGHYQTSGTTSGLTGGSESYSNLDPTVPRSGTSGLAGEGINTSSSGIAGTHAGSNAGSMANTKFGEVTDHRR